MTESRRPYGAPQPEPIDDNEDRMGSVRELDFDEDEPSSAQEEGNDYPADWDLSIVDKDDIGGGDGLDEAELGRLDPFDGKPEQDTPE